MAVPCRAVPCQLQARQEGAPYELDIIVIIIIIITSIIIITNKRTINTLTVDVTAVCLYNAQYYMFRQFPVTIREFTVNVLLSYTCS